MHLRVCCLLPVIPLKQTLCTRTWCFSASRYKRWCKIVYIYYKDLRCTQILDTNRHMCNWCVPGPSPIYTGSLAPAQQWRVWACPGLNWSYENYVQCVRTCLAAIIFIWTESVTKFHVTIVIKVRGSTSEAWSWFSASLVHCCSDWLKYKVLCVR